MPNKKLNSIVFISLLLKLFVVLFFHEKNLTDEWSTLFENFQNYNSYSYYIFDGQPVPSSYMPPLYFFFLKFNKLLSFNQINFLYLVYFNQILISTITVFIFFKICKNFFNEHTSLVGTLIFSLFPLIVYSNALISSATLQLFLYLLFFKFFLDLLDNKLTKLNLFLMIVISSLNLILRGEFLVIFLFSIIFLIILDRRKIIQGLCLLIFSFTLISPYIVRNFDNTEKFHIVNSSGYALWKGNNSITDVEGFFNPLHPDDRSSWPQIKDFEKLYKKLDNIKKDHKYEIRRDEVFKEEAIKNILSDKSKYFFLYTKKFFSYFFIDFNSSIKNYYNIAHIFPVILIALLSIPGLIICLTKNKNKKTIYLTLITLLIVSVISVFNILPRYKISIISFQIIFSLFLYNYYCLKFKKDS